MSVFVKEAIFGNPWQWRREGMREPTLLQSADWLICFTCEKSSTESSNTQVHKKIQGISSEAKNYTKYKTIVLLYNKSIAVI